MALIQNAKTFPDVNGMTKLGSSHSSSATGTNIINNIFSDTFNSYFFHLEVLLATSGQNPIMQFVDSGGNIISAGNYYYAYEGRDQGSNDESGAEAGASGFKFGPTGNARVVTVHGFISSPTSGNDNAKKCTWIVAGFDASNNALWRSGAGFYTASADYTGINIMSTSGNLSQHALQVYGIRESLKMGGY